MVGQIRRDINSASGNIIQLANTWNDIGNKIKEGGLTIIPVRTSDDSLGMAFLAWWKGERRDCPVGISLGINKK